MIVNICDPYTYISFKDVIRTDILIINVNNIRIKRTISKFVKQADFLEILIFVFLLYMKKIIIIILPISQIELTIFCLITI
jgi:hypothetical protein